MQPFPTAFWKSPLAPLEEVSCFSVENAFFLQEDDDGNSEYFLGEAINTNFNPYFLANEISTSTVYNPGIHIDAIAADADVEADTAFTFSELGDNENFYNPKLYTKNFVDLIKGDLTASWNDGDVTAETLFIRFGPKFEGVAGYVQWDYNAIFSDWPIFMISRYKEQIASDFQVRFVLPETKDGSTKISTVGEWKASSGLDADTGEPPCNPLERLLITTRNRTCGKGGNYLHPHHVMEKHFSYVWMKKSGLHKTHPVTVTASEDCKTITAKCYFEKDLTQKFSEIENKGYNWNFDATYSLIPEQAEDYLKDTIEMVPYFNADDELVRNLIEHGYNGYSAGEDDAGGPAATAFASKSLNYLYRQAAKVDIGINLSQANNIIIKVRGLGSDDDGSLYTDADPNTIQKFSKQKAEEDYDNTVDLIPGMPENFMGGEDYLAYGDRQTCTIIVNNRPEIFATSPNAGVYQRDSRYNLKILEMLGDGHDLNVDHLEQFTNFAKGPVRVFQRTFDSISSMDNLKFNKSPFHNSNLLQYKFEGTGGDLDLETVRLNSDHLTHSSSKTAIEKTTYSGAINPNGHNLIRKENRAKTYSHFRGRYNVPNFHHGHGLEYIHKADGTPYVPDSFANYYGTLYNPSISNANSHFYDYDSITSDALDSPPYRSPYTYQQTLALPAGENKIEIVFDSVFNFLNGGAYYEIEVSYT
tara:strand:- start:987 stop:3083 length:2097 start_codon:yes stop_codon:yes gene_type:complete